MSNCEIRWGVLQGEVYALQEQDELDALLTQLARMDAEPQVFLTPFPDRRLASLMPHAAGFVFRSGSILCHLAILLREQRIPAVIAPDLYDSLDETLLQQARTITLQLG